MPEPYAAVYTGNITDGNSRAVYGNIHGNINFGGEGGGSVLNQCLRDLRVTDPREDRARIEEGKDTLLRSCYGWILNNPTFRHWRTAKESRLLWIQGDPGKGKTMMTMGIIDELSPEEMLRPKSMKAGSSPGLVAFFFCQNARPQLNNAVSVLRGLIYMLVRQKEDLMPHVQKQYDITGSKLFDGPNAVYALKEILSKILHDPSLPITYLLIDALDECVSGRPDILRIITDDKLAPRSKVKWMVTSRNVPDIKRYLQPGLLEAKVSLEVSTSQVSEAVAAYVSYKVQQLAKSLDYDPSTEAEVKQVLCEKAEGTFLWVSLVCKELEEVPLYRTRAVLQDLPPRLDPLYKRMMAQILAQKDVQTAKYCKDILRSTTLAYRPLHLEEIAMVAGLPNDLFHQVKAIVDLVSRCGSFLTIRQNIVSFIHLSARDYLMSDDSQKIFGQPASEEAKQIAIRILDIMHRTLHQDICSLKSMKIGIQKAKDRVKDSILPRITYACEYWVDHVQQCAQNCDSVISDGGKVDELFRCHFLHWVEAMTLLQKLPEAILALRKLQLVMNRPNSTKLAQFVQDALLFLMWSSSGIQNKPLQVYRGALIFSPKRSLVRQLCLQEISKQVEVRIGLENDWGPIPQSLEGHHGKVKSVVFSHEGERIAAASTDETVRVWETHTGNLVCTFEDHTDCVNSVVFAPKGDRLASASHDKTVRIWNVTGQLLHTLRGHASKVNSVAFSFDGSQLASGSNDRTVCVWDATGHSLHTLEGHTDKVTSVAFAPRGQLLASSSRDGTIRMWDTETGNLLYILECLMGFAQSVVFSPTRNELVSGLNNGWLRVWDLDTREFLYTAQCHVGKITSISLPAAGDRIALVSRDGIVNIRNANNLRSLNTLVGHLDGAKSVAFSSTGDKLVTGYWHGSVLVWDLKHGQLPQTLQGHLNEVSCIAFSPAGDRIASGSLDRTLKLWDIKTGELLHILTSHSAIGKVAFSPAGNRVAAGSLTGRVQIWDANTEDILYSFKAHTGDIATLVFSPTGDQLVSGSTDGTVRIWGAETGQPMHTLAGHTDTVSIVVISLTGDRLASGCSDGTVRVWNAKTGNLLCTNRDFRQRVDGLVFLQGSLLVWLDDALQRSFRNLFPPSYQAASLSYRQPVNPYG
ncbi:WD40 repeat-like protein [Aaosphaeria arxii CBS 175.79]|uniref:WD40 repeat-like protein n=1 Tax=Aaosphaeria arxii CBS 175.79 TaxID=1450172 RepID=A0A6A5XS52_9PLEO|nr:WD40 repeat-like protein [Aaosphaeria arxii CBS 175.79]KAF2015094.1 WD40 repeat-like protein [Aaosphaeria arxii CBS 175.79]